ncbi:sigma-70 family RNA polymerase sigma factor [Actinocrispum sp. NPDC049592]|uniref:sigma-70 family RNA polymerase sigma factor n=1 Tax=Actinocrispum sp. NPDC049592 TaxID=3154835 RepID=UPI003448A93F
MRSTNTDTPAAPPPTMVVPPPRTPLEPPPPTAAEEEVADFQRIRPRLFGIAYRMLGRVTDAEDVVQDVWLRWQRADRTVVRDRTLFLVKVTSRVALNVARTARVRRESPAGRWPSAEIIAPDDPAGATERAQEIERALLLLQQRLSPTERAVFVLREAFEYPFRDIAEALELSEANSRQLARRARAHLAERRQAPVHRAVHDRLMSAFASAAQSGAMARLERILADDVVAGQGNKPRHEDWADVGRQYPRTPRASSHTAATAIAGS